MSSAFIKLQGKEARDQRLGERNTTKLGVVGMAKIDTNKCTGYEGCIDLCFVIAIIKIDDVVSV
jgi:ferredoxin